MASHDLLKSQTITAHSCVQLEETIAVFLQSSVSQRLQIGSMILISNTHTYNNSKEILSTCISCVKSQYRGKEI